MRKEQTDIEVLKERLRGMDKAYDVQLAEVYRRLDVLNHANEYISEMQHTYLPREIYDERHRELSKLAGDALPRDVYEKTLEEWHKWRANVDLALARAAERKAVYGAIIAAGLALVAALINTVLRIHTP